MVGKKGRVYSVDLQKGMLDRLKKRAMKAGVADIIETHKCGSCKIGLDVRLDFALAFWMIHETSDYVSFLKQIFYLLKPGGILYLADPKMHVSLPFFDETISAAEKIGFKVIERPKIALSWTAVLSRK
jgi:ubiquinone/menaquinone biosynthesis C-methylase UbiE